MQHAEPWYRQFDMWAAKANQYLSALARLPDDAPHHTQLKAFANFSQAQLIFESNLIEGAGLSEGETRKLIEQHFPQIPSSYEAFQKSQRSLLDYIDDAKKQRAFLHDLCLQWDLAHNAVVPSVLLAKKSRSIIEVTKHALALQVATGLQQVFTNHLMLYRIISNNQHIQLTPELKKFRKLAIKKMNELRNGIEEYFGRGIYKGRAKLELDVHPQLIDEESIRVIHLMMAESLLPKDAGVLAGQYRIDNRIVGWDIVFPAPELIPAAMQRYVATAQEVLTKALVGRLDRFLAAARISYDFVRIHPFPDFNGRVSRLLLMMVLNACGVPFSITLRGDSKSKKRYFRALRYANAGNLDPYASLIAMRVVQAFEDVEQNLAIAGLPSLLSFAPPRRRRMPPARSG
jgi:fido (protein-threonine AMPylation protein)